MEKHIIHWGYWVGLACVAISAIWRVLVIFGLPAAVKTVAYSTLYKAALVLFVAAITAAARLLVETQKPA